MKWFYGWNLTQKHVHRNNFLGRKCIPVEIILPLVQSKFMPCNFPFLCKNHNHNVKLIAIRHKNLPYMKKQGNKNYNQKLAEIQKGKQLYYLYYVVELNVISFRSFYYYRSKITKNFYHNVWPYLCNLAQKLGNASRQMDYLLLGKICKA